MNKDCDEKDGKKTKGKWWWVIFSGEIDACCYLIRVDVGPTSKLTTKTNERIKVHKKRFGMPIFT